MFISYFQFVIHKNFDKKTSFSKLKNTKLIGQSIVVRKIHDQFKVYSI